MFTRWLLVCGAIACLGMTDGDVYALSAVDAPTGNPADRGECVGDFDGDGDTDWSDLCYILWCVSVIDCKDGDLDGDGDFDLADLQILMINLGCGEPDVVCEEPGEGLISVAVIAIDNSSVGPGDDPLAPAFDGGVTHFTFDLRVNIEDPWGDWCAADVDSFLDAPDVAFFLHPRDLGGNPCPDPGMLTEYPALEFDSYWCGASVIPPGESGSYPMLMEAVRTSTEMSAFWFDLDDTGDGTFTIMRFTIVMPTDAPAPPVVVPTGTGGTSPVIGTITGLAGSGDSDPPCVDVAFDVIINCGEDGDGDGVGEDCDNCPLDYNPSQEDCDGDGVGNVCDCPGDLDCDNLVDLSDLAELLAHYDATTGMTYAQGDLDDDGDVDLSDLAALLAEYGAVCQ